MILQISRPAFQFRFRSHLFSEYSGPKCAKFRCGKSRSSASQRMFRFQICCSVSKSEHLEGDWGRKSKPNFAFLTPVKLGDGWAKCVWILSVFGLIRPNHDILLTGSRSAVWEIIGSVSKKAQQQNRRPWTYVWRPNNYDDLRSTE